MTAKIPGWDKATPEQKLDLIHDWLMSLSGRVQDHEKALPIIADRLNALEKTE